MAYEKIQFPDPPLTEAEFLNHIQTQYDEAVKFLNESLATARNTLGNVVLKYSNIGARLFGVPNTHGKPNEGAGLITWPQIESIPDGAGADIVLDGIVSVEVLDVNGAFVKDVSNEFIYNAQEFYFKQGAEFPPLAGGFLLIRGHLSAAAHDSTHFAGGADSLEPDDLNIYTKAYINSNLPPDSDFIQEISISAKGSSLVECVLGSPNTNNGAISIV